MTKESRDDIIYRWSMTRDLREFVRLGKELHPEISEEVWTQAFKDSVETGPQSKDALNKLAEITIREAEKRPTWDDFLNATERQEKEAILQKMYDELLTPEEIEGFFPKD